MIGSPFVAALLAISSAGATDGVLPFVENLGQWPPRILYAAHGNGLTVAIEQAGIAIVLDDARNSERRRRVFRLVLDESVVSVVGEVERKARHHYLIGSDPGAWVRNARAFEHVTLLDKSGAEIACTVAPEGIQLLPRGETARALLAGARDHPQGLPLGLQSETASIRLTSDGHVPNSSPDGALVPTTGLVWSAFLGGVDAASIVTAIARAEDGGIIVAGWTGVMDFPVTPGAFDTRFGGGTGTTPKDAFVSRLSSDGTELLFSTFLGGTDNNETIYDIAVKATGDLVVVGESFSSDYPTTPGAYAESPNGLFKSDAIVTVLTPDGSELVYSTFFGGTDFDRARSIVDVGDDFVTLSGFTDSLDIPITSPGGSLGDAFQGFTTALRFTDNALLYSTPYGSPVGGVRSDGLVVLATGGDVPATSGAFDTTPNGSTDIYIGVIDPIAGEVVIGTLLGGNGTDVAIDLAEGPFGEIVVVGSSNFSFGPNDVPLPTTPGAFDTTPNSSQNAFVSVFDPTLSTLLASTFLGGGGLTSAHAVAVDSSGVITVSGSTRAEDFPTTPGAFLEVDPDGSVELDVFVARLDPTLSQLYYSTYLGGNFVDGSVSGGEMDMLLADDGSAIVAGKAGSDDFPAAGGGFGQAVQGVATVFVAELTMLPRGVARYGGWTPGCEGPLALSVTQIPQGGTSSFGVTSTGASPGNGAGLLALSTAPLATPVTIGGAQVWIDPTRLVALVPSPADAAGYALTTLHLPGGPPFEGFTFYAQSFWPGECGPGVLAASDALGITIQP